MWLFTRVLTLLPLWPSAAAPPLEGTLRLWANANGCPGHIVYSFATHKPLGPLVLGNNILTPLASIIELTSNSKGPLPRLVTNWTTLRARITFHRSTSRTAIWAFLRACRSRVS